MAKIFVSRRVPMWDEVSKPLYEAGHEVTVFGDNRRISREELKAEVARGYDGLLTLLTEKVDKEILEADGEKRIKMIANYAVGFDNIDVSACSERGIMVSNTPCDEVNEAVAEFSWAVILAMTRRLGEAGEFMRNAAYKGWEPEVFLGHEVRGKTLGLVGMGRIGGMVAKRAVGFGTRVIYFNRSRLEEAKEKELGVEYRTSVEELVKESDIVSLHVPLTNETKHLINGKNLALFKKGALLVNTARGPVVNEMELVEALRAGFLGGYAGDVFENEPDPHPELLAMENVILTPHIASGTVESRRAMGKRAVENLVTGLAGGVPADLVKPKV